MLMFILHAHDRISLTHTRESLSLLDPEWTIVTVEADLAKAINQHLSNYHGDFFIILHAGDVLLPGFLDEVRQWQRDLPKQSAGIVINPAANELTPGSPHGLSDPQRNHPVMWRTRAVKEEPIPFLERDRLPFEPYTLFEMASRLAVQWTWHHVSSRWLHLAKPQVPKWRNLAMESSLLRPFLVPKLPIHIHEDIAEPAVTVAVCSYNNADYLLWAIHSVISQTIPDWEVILVDDGSADHTPAQLKKLPHDPRIRLVHNPQNRGKATCLNQALSLARGRWFVELDADDWLATDTIERLLAYSGNLPESCAVLYGDHYEWYEEEQERFVYREIRKGQPAFHANRLLSEGIPLAPRMYRTEALKETGGWLVNDPFHGRLYEDFQMLIRLSWRYQLSHVPLPLYHRRIRSDSVSHLHLERYAKWKDWFLREYRSGGQH